MTRICCIHFGTMHPGLVTLHNYPRCLQQFERPRRQGHRPGSDGHPCAAASSACRATTIFGGNCTCPAPSTFEEFTGYPRLGWPSCASVYDGDIDGVDLTVGMLRRASAPGLRVQRHRLPHLRSDGIAPAEQRPLLHHRLHRPGVHASSAWTGSTRNHDELVLLRHYPELAPMLAHGAQRAPHGRRGAGTRSRSVGDPPRAVNRLRFWLYRTILAFFTLLGVGPAEGPPARRCPWTARSSSVPYAELYPDMPLAGLAAGMTSPGDRGTGTAHAASGARPMLIPAFVRWLVPAHTRPSVPDRRARFLRVVLTRGSSGGRGRRRRCAARRPLRDTDEPGRRAGRARAVRERVLRLVEPGPLRARVPTGSATYRVAPRPRPAGRGRLVGRLEEGRLVTRSPITPPSAYAREDACPRPGAGRPWSRA